MPLYHAIKSDKEELFHQAAAAVKKRSGKTSWRAIGNGKAVVGFRRTPPR